MNSLSTISGIGPKTLLKLRNLNINTLNDIVYHFPSRYIDFSHITKIANSQINTNVTITGKIISIQNIYTRQSKNLQRVIVKDDTDQIHLIWFNQPYILKNLKAGMVLSFAGTVSTFGNQKTIINPEYGQYHTGKIIPIYPETRGLSSKWFRKTIQSYLPTLTQISDSLPSSLVKKYHLLSLEQALTQIHLPKNSAFLNQARLRLAIDEILSVLTKSYLQKKNWLEKSPNKKIKITTSITKKINTFIKSLPFKLTDSQKKVWGEIREDLVSKNHVVNRLLCGDVGSGKTIIAILACYLTHLNNSLSLVLAPTSILARQHFQNFSLFLKDTKAPVFLLTASSRLDTQKVPKNSIIISTHSAFYQKKSLVKLVGLLVVDEQHKFGVKQRSFFSNLNTPPHCLTMSATPIPRTISLSMLGNLSLSTLDTVPKNRLRIKTFLVPPTKKIKCYQWLKKQITKEKVQAFIVCPFIDNSETLTSVKSATKEFAYLSKIIFPDLKLSLIHGKIKHDEKQKILKNFQGNKINILVTTPIIEVGIDFPNSTIIIIQSADRFGLAQLHQLRGRVGRGTAQSYCFFFTESENEKTINRLKYLQNHHNGLDIANYDLKTRGPGELFSTLQHGFPSLKLANLSDFKLISFSQKILQDIIKSYPSFDLSKLAKNTITDSISN